MRVNSLHLPEELTNDVGIAAIRMDRLGHIVALIGKNGSGKSRILNLLENWYLQNLSYEDYFNKGFSYVPPAITEIVNQANSVQLTLQANHDDSVDTLSSLQERLKAVTPKTGVLQAANVRQEYKNLKKKIEELQLKLNREDVLKEQKKALDVKLNVLHKKYFHRIRYLDISNLQAALDPGPPSREVVTFEQLMDAALMKEDYNELIAMTTTGLPYLAKLPNELLDDYMDTLDSRDEFESRSSWKKFRVLAKYVKLFLNKELTWDRKNLKRAITSEGVTSTSQGRWKLNKRVFNYIELSEGEKTLFAYSLLFFLLENNANLRIQESIIVIDEPELHLHPESEFTVIEKISELLKEKGQLWIATHSIPILSNLSYDEIFMVKSGEVTAPSRITPGETFIELMGIEEHIDKLSHFVTNISNWAFLNFMTQCFTDPDTIKHAESNDPEFELFKKSIKESDSNVVLLDFGAGRGRIYREIKKDEKLIKKIQYSALEPNQKNALELEELSIPIYTTYNDLPNENFDKVLLCNVLHEIPISQWQSTLNRIKLSIKQDGFLVIIEDLRLPKGEKIDEAGFIIMDPESLSKLFYLDKLPLLLLTDDVKYRDRILCAVIPKSSIRDITKESVIESLQTLQENTFEKIKESRKKRVTKESKLALGRELAFYSQLYINSLLALEIINEAKQ